MEHVEGSQLAAADPASPPAEQPQYTYVLVVDDDEANRESLARRLRRRGMTVDLAVDGADALARIDAAPYDLVLLDVMMPGLSGLEVLQKVRETRPPTELPIIMATANDTSDEIAQAFELGANDYVTKPIDFTVALARVKTQLDMGRAVREAMHLKRDLSLRNAELENAVEQLRRSAERTRGDMELAARVQATFLPRDLPPDARYKCAWRYLPCDQLAGDALNVCTLGRDHVAFYVLDVTGHGVASSLTAVTAARMLAPAHDPVSILVGPGGPKEPAAVMAELTSRFTFDAETGQFITCFYAVLDLLTGQLDYVSAGHPDARYRQSPATAAPRASSPAPACPSAWAIRDEQQTTTVQPGDRVWLYSDGVTEAMSPTGVLFGPERLLRLLPTLRPGTLDDLQAEVLNQLTAWRETGDLADDVSLLTFERR